jgi:hypothetical protein
VERKRWINRVIVKEKAMKKTALGCLFLMGAALLGAQTAYIEQVRGVVEVKAPGAGAWRAAEAGQVLDTAWLISTGIRSTALVKIGNSSITVRPLTRLSLEELTGAREGERVTLNLRAGRVRADVKPPAGGGRTSFAIRGPTVTASVRGTVFDFDGSRVEVSEGRVYLGGEHSAGVYISGGHAAAADPGTGGAAAVIETVKEELVPALPAGVDAAPVVISPGAAGGSLDIRFDWSGQ